jgi:O-acetyl-ADP-ribose deacetylase (regulator of RNase III)
VWQGGESGEPERLASAYRSAVSLAREHGARSLAFPAISTGIYGYPLVPATTIAVASVREAAGAPLERIVFACFGPEVLAAYRAAGVEVAA